MNKRHILPLLIALLIYGTAAYYQIDLPGLHHDEAQEAGLNGMQLQNGLPLTLFRDTGFVVANRAFPLMVQDYIGALNAYLAWFAFGIGGVSVQSLRIMTILTGMLTLVFGFLATRKLAGDKAAALMVLMLAVHPTYVFWTRQGVYVTSYTLTLALAAFWLMLRWSMGGKGWNLALAAFLMGVGLWGKLLFIWFMGAVCVAWIVLNLPHLYRWLRRQDSLRPDVKTPPISILIAIFCGVIGLTPLMIYNIRSGGTFDNIFNNLDQSYYGVDNSNVVVNFRERLRQAPLVYESGHLRELGGLYPNPVARIWLYAGGILCLAGAALRREKRGVRLFIVLVVVLMIAQSSFTSTALWFTHFALILPFMVMMNAIGAVALVDILRWIFYRLTIIHRDGFKNPPLHVQGSMFRLVGQIFFHFSLRQNLLAILLTLMMSFDLLSTALYHDALHRTGGIATQSAVIYDLADELDSLPPGYPVVALDWGISPAVQMLTEARIIPNEVFGYDWQPDPGFAARLQPYLALDESLYVLHVPAETVFPRRDAFLQIAAESGREMVLDHTLSDRLGNPYFEIWRAANP